MKKEGKAFKETKLQEHKAANDWGTAMAQTDCLRSCRSSLLVLCPLDLNADS